MPSPKGTSFPAFPFFFPPLFVALAAYGDYAPGYIGTEVSSQQGGYETSPKASLVAPTVEAVIMDAMKRLLHR